VVEGVELSPAYSIVLDGNTAEWPADAAALATEHFLFLRFTVEGEQFTLQSAPRSVSVFLDTDNSAATGMSVTDPADPRHGMGIDLELQFSPTRPDGSAGRGVALYTIDQQGLRTRHKAADFDFAVTPTYASSWYELRISRTPDGSPALPAAGLLGLESGAVRGVVGIADAAGIVTHWADPFLTEIEPSCSGGKALSPLGPPEAPAGTVRVVSWNVERSAPMTNPEPFRRILRALKPDVLLLQEWDQGDDAAVAAWLESAIAGPWNVVKAAGGIDAGGGVLVASRYPVEPSHIPALTSEGEKPIRFVSAIVKTSWGDLLAGSAHLKCCGTLDSREDRQRMSEARAINAAVQAVSSPSVARVFAGDLNLVGSRPPLELLRAGIDTDGTDLAIADARVLGDITYSTWRDSRTDFPPGRLDFMVFSDAASHAAQAFVFDTERLSPAALEPAGLLVTDSAASDHLPVVVDLAPKGPN